ncbi:DUF3137 domain-containing protein [Flavobacterium hercynium]|uniref:Galanin n=1 Tax=Flavobacterium hercynium TaxID=387094 RepID=A0A226HHV2_9FLAO|nr:DUF3137 domain-containing protein [Flavobacterium hercynium]OXA93857.1 galanin [Flavobacterium hercynium]SMP20068.1 Protein of unknown function [Flavobacterium hercynium]
MDSKLNNDLSLKAILDRLETKRIDISSNIKFYSYLKKLSYLIVIVGIYYDYKIIAAVMFFLCFIFVLLGNARTKGKLESYKEEYKSEVIPLALKQINKSLVFEPNNGVPHAALENSMLFTRVIDRFVTQDFIYGMQDKTAFCFSEVRAEFKSERQTNKGIVTKWYPIFQGIIFVVDFNKNFKVSTIVRSKEFGDDLGGWLSRNVFNSGNSERVQLENASFNKEFTTYSKDQIEARYILTPKVIEGILKLNDKSDKTISLSFINSSLYVALPLKADHFEASIRTSLTGPDFFSEDRAIVQFMHDIVHELDLNTRIWGKE